MISVYTEQTEHTEAVTNLGMDPGFRCSAARHALVLQDTWDAGPIKGQIGRKFTENPLETMEWIGKTRKTRKTATGDHGLYYPHWMGRLSVGLIFRFWRIGSESKLPT